jgi:hypothetical protein
MHSSGTVRAEHEALPCTTIERRSLLAAVSLLGAGLAFPACAAQAFAEARRLPEFTHRDAQDWINHQPLRVSDLAGSIVLLDVWTFGCWNCYRSFPWLRGVESRFSARGLRVVGVHAPELEHERSSQRVRAKVKEFRLTHPIMIDGDHSYWRALQNRYWPTFYLVDRDGRIRSSFAGETHAGDAQAERIEQNIEALLRERT